MFRSIVPSHSHCRRGKIASFLVATTGLVLSVSCATSYQPPRTVPQVFKNQVIGSDIETVWRGAIRYFADRNVPIETMDHSSYYIKTKAPLAGMIGKDGGVQFSGDSVAFENEWCDCGTAKITNVWGTTSKITVSYNLVLTKRSEEQTEVVLNVFFTGAYYGKRNRMIPGYDVEVPLECVSKGVLERNIVEYLKTFK